ncbi:hypothetical protein [Streptomyces sp. NPDC058671]|uniref:hypothetical protein n=1 Tax=Streptomyces sp. NPDC058671 TaxID=3346590 RepID=UPI00364C204D
MTTTDRRALLTAGVSAAAAALAGCTSEAPGPRRPSAAQREAERVARAETELRLRAVTASRTLLERYDATLAAHPALAPLLNPLRRSVAAHTKAFGEGGTTVRPATAAPTASATSVAPTPAPVPVAGDPRAALGELAAAEGTASDAHTAALLTAPPEYARLLASVAAACAAHAYLLTEGARA